MPRLRALAFLIDHRFQSTVLETVQLEATEDGRGVLRAVNQDGGAEVEVPLLEVVRPGKAQLPTFPVLRVLVDVAASPMVEIEELCSAAAADTFSFMTNPKAPSRNVVVRTSRPRPGQSSVMLSTWSPAHFPALTPAKFARSSEIDAWKLRQLLTPTTAHSAAAAADRDSILYAASGCDFEVGDEAPSGFATDGGGSSLTAWLSSGTGTGAIAQPLTAVADAKRLLALALPSQSQKALAMLLDTIGEAVLTLGFILGPEEKLQVQGPDFLFVASLLSNDRHFAPQAADCPGTTVTQEPKQKVFPAEETPVAEHHLPARTLSMSMPAPTRNQEERKDRPVRVIKLKNIRGNVWANRLQSGQVVYNVTLDRLWKEDDEVDGSGNVTRKGEWHQTQSFGRDDLLLVAKVADLCHSWIFDRIEKDSRRGQDF